MRVITVILIILLALIQYPLWAGQGGWLHVHELAQQLAAQQQRNAALKLRNDQTAGEVEDLRSGTLAIEERARYELGMIKDSEIFMQFVSPDVPIPLPPGAATGKAVSTRGRMSAAPLTMVPEPPLRAKSGKPERGSKKQPSANRKR